MGNLLKDCVKLVAAVCYLPGKIGKAIVYAGQVVNKRGWVLNKIAPLWNKISRYVNKGGRYVKAIGPEGGKIILTEGKGGGEGDYGG